MEHEFEFGPAFTLMTVHLSNGEQLKVEPGAMVAQSSNVDMKSGMSGGFFKGLMKSMVGGESFILNTYTSNGETWAAAMAQGRRAQISLAPPSSGEASIPSNFYALF